MQPPASTSTAVSSKATGTGVVVGGVVVGGVVVVGAAVVGTTDVDANVGGGAVVGAAVVGAVDAVVGARVVEVELVGAVVDAFVLPGAVGGVQPSGVENATPARSLALSRGAPMAAPELLKNWPELSSNVLIAPRLPAAIEATTRA